MAPQGSPGGHVRAVVFDWAGTLVDYGSLAPVRALQNLFRQRGIELTADEARRHMGLRKRDHIRELLRLPRVRRLWVGERGREPEEADVAELDAGLLRALEAILARHAEPNPGVLDALEALRRAGIRIGSTTGYAGPTAEALAAAARTRGVVTDALAHSTEVPSGRPAPWMCYLNAMRLDVFPMQVMVKVGDTPVDMREGRNAGMWAVGVVFGSSAMGLSPEEEAGLDPAALGARAQRTREAFRAAGAHYVVDRLDGLAAVLAEIGGRLAAGGLPQHA